MHWTVKQIRVYMNKTQNEMAALLGVCRDTYVKYEQNPDLMPMKCVKAISKASGVSINDIFFDTDSSATRAT